jgi:hypothetical protein
MQNRANILRIQKLADQGKEANLDYSTPTQRLAMMWRLALDAWAFKGDKLAESRLPRHVVSVQRRER